jgi:hypothetical protein
MCFITDLGLCGPVDDKSSSKIYGIIPYIAPEVFQEKKIPKNQIFIVLECLCGKYLQDTHHLMTGNIMKI